MDSLRSGWRPLALCACIVGAGWSIEWLDPFPDDRHRIQLSPESMPSTRVIPGRAVVEGTELLSLVLDQHDLSSPERGLLTHPEARGRDWERRGYVSFFSGGRLQLATQAGVRLHGGRSRLYSPVKSFRLYFRRKYGPPAIPSAVFFGPGLSNDLTSVIAHNDVRTDRMRREWHLVNPIAYDIAARLGGIVPRTRPTRFVLNGEPQGMYVITERITPEFFQARFGHSNFAIDPPSGRNHLLQWATTAKPFTMRDVSGVVDLDNLTSWALTVLFCATSDVLSQSPLIKDLSDPKARWFWVTWDLDHSFMDVYRRASQPWLLDSYRTLLANREGRSQILTRLFRDDQYRRYFAARMSAALNHQLTPRFLDERFGHYRETALRRGAVDNGYLQVLERFLAERPQVLWDLTAKYLKTGAPLTVAVTGPAGEVIDIDGVKTSLPYTGKYLPGTQFVLDGGASVAAWRIDGRLLDSPRVSFAVTANVEIAAAHRSDERSPR